MRNATPQGILFIDPYDSFSNNIVALLETELHVAVTVIKSDAVIDDFPAFVNSFLAVVAGPGPGHPANSADVGLIEELWKLDGDCLVPILGICLGFQSLVYTFGGSVEPLPEPRHGILRTIRSCGDSMFRGCDTIQSIQYHSLRASLGHAVRCNEDAGQCAIGRWESAEASPELVPLAWDCAKDNLDSAWKNPQAILMAVAHDAKPFYGIQFHPESICSTASARAIISNWWHEVLVWRAHNCPTVTSVTAPQASSNEGISWGYRGDVNEDVGRTEQKEIYGSSLKELQSLDDRTAEQSRISQALPTPPTTPSESRQILSKVIETSHVTVPGICQTLGLTGKEVVVLDSEMHQRHDVSTHSIIGIIASDSLRLEYYIKTNHVVQRSGETLSTVDLRHYGGSIYDYLKVFMADHKAVGGDPEVPFWGGLMGYITYEACLETIDIPSEPKGRGMERPDMSFVLAERSILISHQNNTVTVQSTRESDGGWVSSTADLLRSLNSPEATFTIPSFSSTISYPLESAYKSSIRSCQDEIRIGNAYELCLTDRACIKTNPPHLPSWQLYLRLRKINAAPFNAFIRLGPLTLLSSSPERFLRWSRPQRASFDQGQEVIGCQFRPIKGTVKKGRADAGLPDVTLAEATALLSTAKERAENLMIVDLIRHDLHGVVGSARVKVPKLMVVEEYETVFQLVTVIEGELLLDKHDTRFWERANGQTYHGRDDVSCNGGEGIYKKARLQTSANLSMVASTAGKSLVDPQDQKRHESGIDILASSLPPGSMTGAPKRRACKILHSVEDRKPRGVYSGVIGYLDVGGGGDFSVVIRSAVRWENPCVEPSTDTRATKGRKADLGPIDVGWFPETRNGHTGARHENDEYEWTVGAGGAVTSLSTEDGEWEEMMTKLRSTVRVFEGI